MKIAVFGKNFSKNFNNSIQLMFDKLIANDAEIWIYKPFYDYIEKELQEQYVFKGFFSSETDLNDDTDVLLSIGGDGTFLEASSFVRKKEIPILGINSGRLGFLANISKENLAVAIDELLQKKYKIENRCLIQLCTDFTGFSDFPYALNEFTIHKRDSSSMITMQVFLNEQYLNTYWADGLIISTPTGSTAYSMSVGGPILTPDSSNFIIVPIAPHTLTVRPIVIPDIYHIRIHVEGRSKNYMISLDHKNEVVKSSVDIVLKRAEFTISSIRLDSQNYYTTLRNKLSWGIDNRN
ncbi:MAG: NAD kinase [Bacteroidetes bacterium RIFOXYA12_FULL_35_11]|nr:MAG: NAD kinase [Bacteroidetes bacterium GWF2_35_48]OFY78897.1 MAG: NAD kinase [Bacteroidetes bacterium RIFOXYA12_FULL_35_11]HBX53630.1 NAD kinase [Bacteroidales bacterium]